MSAPPEVQYARAKDGIDVAYLASKEEPDVVLVPGFVSHLDLQFDLPPISYLYRRLTDRHGVLVFDKRGTGLSDRTLGFGSLEERMEDIGAVMDAAGVEQASLVGISEGGPLATLFAATYPERVRRLVVYGSFARLTWAPDHEFGMVPEIAQRFYEWCEEDWGSGQVLRVVVNHAPPEADRILARFERTACTPQMTGEIMRRNFEIDIRPLLPTVSAPTRVIHVTEDPAMPVGHGRSLAAGIPGAELVEVSGDYHMHWQGAQMEPVADAMVEFLGDRHVETPRERILATVLFTDIVGSTARAAELGDGEWRSVLDRHDAASRHEVEQLGGRVVKTTGDGMLAVFDSPSSGVRCANALRSAVEPIGLGIRAGVHTGEIERRGDDVGGIGVHIAARVASMAGSGEIWASRTVKDLTAGSGLEFADQGRHTLKGVPEEWDLFSVSS